MTSWITIEFSNTCLFRRNFLIPPHGNTHKILNTLHFAGVHVCNFKNINSVEKSVWVFILSPFMAIVLYPGTANSDKKLQLKKLSHGVLCLLHRWMDVRHRTWLSFIALSPAADFKPAQLDLVWMNEYPAEFMNQWMHYHMCVCHGPAEWIFLYSDFFYVAIVCMSKCIHWLLVDSYTVHISVS